MSATGERAPLSVCIITFNEEDNIRDCLKSVEWADEIVVVDSFSRDRTVDICREFTDKIIQREWEGHISQKTFALESASHDWALCLDADERATPELAAEIQDVLRRVRAGEEKFAGYYMPRRVFYLGRWIRHCGWYPDRKLRLIQRAKARVAGVDPHDHFYVDGPAGRLKGDLLHYSYRNLADHMDRINRYTSTAAEQMLKNGVRMPLMRMLIQPPMRALKMYLLKMGFLDGVPGLIASAAGGYYVFLKYAKLWELWRKNKGSDA
jgi:glycosyltransferase involved in cell wall biosynthesis